LLAKSPDDRYESPAELARALQPFTTGHDLPALLAPARFVPALSVVASDGQAVADRAGDGEEDKPARPRPRRWLPRGDWSRPPRFSNPMAAPGVLVLMPLLLLPHTTASRGHGPRRAPAPPPIRGDAREAPGPVRVGGVRSGGVPATLTARLYRLGPG